MKSQTVLIVAVALSVSLLAAPAHAQTNDGPQFTVAPYFLIPWMTGDVTVRGFDVSVDAGPKDIADNLEFGFMGYFEVRNAGWAFAFDALYMSLNKEASLDTALGPAGVELSVNQGTYEVTGARTLSPWADVVFGARINRIGGSFRTLLTQIEREESKVWVDPLVGVRLSVPDTGRWLVAVRADIGGFGAGSDFAWQIYPAVGYSFVDWFTLAGGYRVLSMDYQTGEGVDEFRYDVTTHGPFVGFAFQF